MEQEAFDVSYQIGFFRRTYRYDPKNTAAPLTLIYESIGDNDKIDTFSISKESLQDVYKRRISKEGFDVALLKQFLGREVKDQATIKYDYDGQVKIGTKSFLSLELMNKCAKQAKQNQRQSCIIQLDEQEKTALVAFQAINFIQNAKQDEILKNTKQSFRLKIINHLQKTFVSEYNDFDQSLEKITRLFLIQLNKDQDQLNAAVMFYDRFKKASIFNGQIIFNPTFLTSEIFKRVLQENQNNLITGNGGLGKSISLWLLARLASFINKIKIHRDLDRCRHFTPFFKNQKMKFLDFPKIYYVTLSENSCFKNMVECIKYQTDFELQSNDLFEILQKIQKEARKNNKSQKVIFIVDQINIYSSIYRRYQSQNIKQKKDQLRQQLLQYTNFLRDLNGKFKIVYSSSVNSQKQFIHKSCSKYIFNFYQLEKHRYIQEKVVGNYKRNPSNHFRFEILHSVLFEISIRFLFRYSPKIKTYEKILSLQNLQIHQPDQYKSIREINPLVLNCFFKNWTENTKYTKIQSMGSVEDQIFVKNLLSEIIEYQRNILKNDYQKFLCKGSQEIKIKKFQVFIALKQKAKERCENNGGQDPSFEVVFDQSKLCAQLEFDSINQQHANIDLLKQSIEIFYSPNAFLQIVRGVQQPMSSFIQLFQQSFMNDVRNPNFLATCVDSYFRQSIAQHQINLTFGKEQFHLKGGKYNYFLHFNRQKQTLNTSLKTLISKFKQAKLKAIGALPFYQSQKSQNSKKISPNSQTIDSLILTETTDSRYKFKLITFDFTILQNKNGLQQKFIKAVDFFIKLSQRINTQDKYPFGMFQIQHYIVAEEKAYKKISVKNKPLTKVKIDWTPIRQFSIQLIQEKQNDLLSQKLKYTYEMLQQRAKQL